MGGIYETERMLEHIEQCAVCKAATKFADRCDVWSDMYQNVADFERGEGPFEGKDDALMCDVCDGPVMPGRQQGHALGRPGRGRARRIEN